MSWSLLGTKGLKSWISAMILLVTWKEGIKKNRNFFLKGGRGGYSQILLRLC